MFWEILKASKGLPVTDHYAALWGKKIAEKINWKVTEITGELPLTFLSDGSVLVDYRIYGTSAGAGVETENLFDKDTYLALYKYAVLDDSGVELSSQQNGYSTVMYPVSPNTAYSIIGKTTDNNNIVSRIYFFYTNKAFLARSTAFANLNVNSIYTFTTPNDARYIEIQMSISESLAGFETVMLVKGSTAPASYIPPGYKLPLTVESGAQSQDIPIYIGDSKLGKEEYVDYGEQKIYKVKPNLVIDTINLAFVNPSGVLVSNSQIDSAITPIQKDWVYTIKFAKFSPGSSMFCGFFENYPVKGATTYNNERFTFASDYYTFTAPIDGYLVTSVSFGKNPVVFEGEPPYLQPTDPPVPLPPVPTFKGENTLSSTETLGEVTIKGRIKEVDS